MCMLGAQDAQNAQNFVRWWTGGEVNRIKNKPKSSIN